MKEGGRPIWVPSLSYAVFLFVYRAKDKLS